MRDDISSAVRDQYEDHPYPRWIAPMIAATARPVEGYLNDAPGVAPISLPGLPKHPRVLVAGCGTGRHAIYVASALAGAEILAIDLSRASLAYARQKADELGIENLRFAQADILELGRIDDRFDVIESSGVLHHMADPLAGWRVLVDLLNPGGVMKVGLYSESGRAGERRAQAIVKDRGLRPDVEGIRRMRAEVKALASAGDETLRLLTKALAFYSASECRDLVFHVMEHRFTIPEIEAALTALNLDFLGFHLPHPGYLAAVRAAQGPDVDVRSLAPWHEFERDNPLAFIGMYQFWCRKPET
jgi:SAM-dependent methyltransferase